MISVAICLQCRVRSQCSNGRVREVVDGVGGSDASCSGNTWSQGTRRSFVRELGGYVLGGSSLRGVAAAEMSDELLLLLGHRFGAVAVWWDAVFQAISLRTFFPPVFFNGQSVACLPRALKLATSSVTVLIWLASEVTKKCCLCLFGLFEWNVVSYCFVFF